MIRRVRDLCREHGVSEPVFETAEPEVVATFKWPNSRVALSLIVPAREDNRGTDAGDCQERSHQVPEPSPQVRDGSRMAGNDHSGQSLPQQAEALGYNEGTGTVGRGNRWGRMNSLRYTAGYLQWRLGGQSVCATPIEV